MSKDCENKPCTLVWHPGPAIGGGGTAQDERRETKNFWWDGDLLLILIELKNAHFVRLVKVNADGDMLGFVDPDTGDDIGYSAEDISWWAKVMDALPTHPPKHILHLAEDINSLTEAVHQQAVDMGWWTDLETGERIERNTGELLMLVVTEIAEAFEGYRKDLMDDHLPHRKMEEVELADAVIRIMDFAGSKGYRLGDVIVEKLIYNRTRHDHTLEARRQPGGKKV